MNPSTLFNSLPDKSLSNVTFYTTGHQPPRPDTTLQQPPISDSVNPFAAASEVEPDSSAAALAEGD
ncbi:MAG: hypothetical protein WBB01_05795, partial [Phormidesmis sp.]